MFRLSLIDLAQAAMALGLLAWAWRTRQRHLPGWVQQLAQSLGARLAAPNRIEGERAGVRYTIRAVRPPHSSAYPLWELTLHGLRGPPFALRAEGAGDRFVKRLGLVEEKALDDPEIDRRVFVAGGGTDALKPMFRNPAVEGAINALWPAKEKALEGHLVWIQSGDDWVAVMNVGGVQAWLSRLDELIDRTIALARAVHAFPTPPAAGRPIPHAVFGTPAWVGPVLLVLGAFIPIGLGINALVAAATMSSVSISWPLFGALGGVGLLVGLARLGLARKQVIIERRWLEPALLLFAGLGLALALSGPINLLREEARRTETLEVTGSREADLGVVEVWSVELAGVGRVGLPLDEAERFKKGDKVEVTWATGALGLPRVLAIAPARVAAAAP